MSSVTDSLARGLGTFAVLLTALCATTLAHAQVFELGGTGADGPLIITSDTAMAVPESGVIQATRVEVAAGATLTFTRNTRNTGVIIVATEEIVINGTIDVSGRNGGVGAGGLGGPGGLDGGNPSLWNDGLWRQEPQLRTCTYTSGLANLLQCQPLAGSEGGRGSYYSATTPTSGCSIGGGGGGGSGSIRLLSHERVSGTGTIRARGGLANPTLPQAGTCTTASWRIAAQNGGDNDVFITAPTIDWSGGLTINSARIGSQAVFQIGSPGLEGNTNHTALTGLTSWEVAPEVGITITHVNGTPVVDGGGPLFVTTDDAQVTIRVRVDGCTGTRAFALVYRSVDESPNYIINNPNSTTINSPSSSEVRDVIMSGLQEGRSYWFRASMRCEY